MIDFNQLIKAGLQFGHQTSRWCPKMEPYIWGKRGGIHLLDVSKIAYSLEKAANFLESTAAEGKSILWVGTKKPAKELVARVAQELNMPYVNHRWVGGTISNFHQVKKAVTKYLHYKDIIAKAAENAEAFHYTKKEIGVFQKTADRMEKIVGGLKDLRMPLGAIILIDVNKEETALYEANAAGIPVIALVDSNGNPTGVDFVIPGNDDSPKGIQLILEYLAARAAKGIAHAKENAVQAVVLEDEVQEKLLLDDADEKPKAKKAVGKKPFVAQKKFSKPTHQAPAKEEAQTVEVVAQAIESLDDNTDENK
jgi:small subunit ribosomal protein S2